MTHTISAIVPTIGRVSSLAALLESLAAQTHRPNEVVVADGSDTPAVEQSIAAARWLERGLTVRHLRVSPPNAVRQRQAAIDVATGEWLLLLDDDVVLEPACVEALANSLGSQRAVAVSADFSNQQWPRPTRLWRWYLRYWLQLSDRDLEGRVVGPLLRFGYFSTPVVPVRMEWLGSGNSLVRRDAYLRAGGFSNFFLHRSTQNEDVDLGIKLAREGTILLCPAARMAHLHAPGGRPSARVLAEDDLYNRYVVLHRTIGRTRLAAITLIVVYFALETISDLGALLRRRSSAVGARANGRLHALMRIAQAPAGTEAP